MEAVANTTQATARLLAGDISAVARLMFIAEVPERAQLFGLLLCGASRWFQFLLESGSCHASNSKGSSRLSRQALYLTYLELFIQFVPYAQAIH